MFDQDRRKLVVSVLKFSAFSALVGRLSAWIAAIVFEVHVGLSVFGWLKSEALYGMLSIFGGTIVSCVIGLVLVTRRSPPFLKSSEEVLLAIISGIWAFVLR
jgi:hypothetical protein